MADYKVAVELTLVGGIAQALALVSQRMMGIHGQTRQIEQGFRSWRPALMGALGVFAAVGIVKGLSDIAKGGDEVMNMMTRLKMQGQTAAAIKESFNWATDVTSKGVGRIMTPSAALGAIKDIAFATGTIEDAMRRLPEVAGLTAIMSSTMPGTMKPEQAAHQTFSLYKMLEEQNLLGAGREKAARQVLEGIAKDIAMTGGKTTPEGYRQTMLMSRAAGAGYLTDAALGMDKPFVSHYLPHIMQAMAGGSVGGGGGTRGVGPLLNAFYQVASLGKINNQMAAREWNKRGFLEGGLRHKGFGPQNIVESDLAARHPYEWMQHRTSDLMKQGFNTWEKLSKEISILFPQRTAAALAALMAQGGTAFNPEGSPFAKSARMFDLVPNFQQLTDFAMAQPKVMEEMYEAQKKGAGELIGMVINPARLSVLNEITKIFTAIKGFAKTPEGVNTIQTVASGLLALAAALAAMGTAAVLGAMIAFGGLPALLIGFGTAMAALSPKVREAISEFTMAMGKGDTAAMREAGRKIADAAIGAFIAGLFDASMHALVYGPAAAGKALGQGIAGLLNPPPSSGATLPPLGFTRPETVGPTYDPLSGLPMWPRPGELTRDPRVPSLRERLPHTGGGPGPETWPVMPRVPGGMVPAPTSPFLPRGGLEGFGGYAPPSTGKMLQKQNWEPQGGGGGTVQVNNTIHLDGAAIARAVNEYQTAGLEHPTQAPYFDGRSSYTAPDWQPVYG